MVTNKLSKLIVFQCVDVIMYWVPYHFTFKSIYKQKLVDTS